MNSSDITQLHAEFETIVDDYLKRVDTGITDFTIDHTTDGQIIIKPIVSVDYINILVKEKNENC